MKSPTNHYTDIFFDLDHTLWDFERNSALAFAEIFSKNNIEVDLEVFLSHYVPINLQYWERYQFDQITQQELRYGRLRDSFDLAGHPVDDLVIGILSEEYIAHLPRYNHIFEGTTEILDYLAAKYRLHIITNGFHHIQGEKLRNAGIDRHFLTVTNSELAGVKKPHPQIFEFALQQAGARKETSLMVGDSLQADVYGAMNCGWDAIYFAPNGGDIPSNVKTITHLLELKQYL